MHVIETVSRFPPGLPFLVRDHHQGERYFPWESVLRAHESPLEFRQARIRVTGYTNSLRTPASSSVGGYRGRCGFTRTMSAGLTPGRVCILANDRSAPVAVT